MSIIYNALKKTQQSHQEVSSEAIEQQVEQRVAPKRVTLFAKLAMGMAGLVIGTLPFFLILHLNHRSPAPIVSPPTKAPSLTLNGVFLTTDDKVAMINNQEYHMGENIEGMKIVAMDINSVTLKQGNKVFKIRSA